MWFLILLSWLQVQFSDSTHYKYILTWRMTMHLWCTYFLTAGLSAFFGVSSAAFFVLSSPGSSSFTTMGFTSSCEPSSSAAVPASCSDASSLTLLSVTFLSELLVLSLDLFPWVPLGLLLSFFEFFLSFLLSLSPFLLFDSDSALEASPLVTSLASASVLLSFLGAGNQ